MMVLLRVKIVLMTKFPRRFKEVKEIKKPKDFGPNIYTFLLENEPKTYSEAMMSSEALFWKEAINDEMDSLISNKTWFLTDLPQGCKTIGCKWVFRKKLRTDGSIEKFKARLVAKCFKQEEGVDFFDTYAPVSKITAIRI